MDRRNRSPAMELIHHIAEHQGEVWGGRSKDRYHVAVTAAIRMAVVCGLRFDPGDFSVLACRSCQHADGLGWGVNETVYTTACAVRRTSGRSYGVNRSACIAYERYKCRKPFIYKGRCPSGERLAVGSEFRLWPESDGAALSRPETWHDVTVTSFAEDGSYLVAVTYKSEDEAREYERRRLGRLHVMEARRVILESARPHEEHGSPIEIEPKSEYDLARRTIARRFKVTREMLLRQNLRPVYH